MLVRDVSPAELHAIAERIRWRVGALTEPHPVTVSIGGAVHPQDGCSLDELVATADRAMYEAKRSGRNRVRLQGVP